MKFDPQDRAAISHLDADFVISPDNELAKLTGEMTVKIVRLTDDRLQLTIEFPGGEELIVRLARSQLLDELGVEIGED